MAKRRWTMGPQMAGSLPPPADTAMPPPAADTPPPGGVEPYEPGTYAPTGFDVPEWDESKIAALGQQFAAPQVGRLNRQMSSWMTMGYDPQSVQARRATVRGYGEALGGITAGAGERALGQYGAEYEGQLTGAKFDWESAEAKRKRDWEETEARKYRDWQTGMAETAGEFNVLSSYFAGGAKHGGKVLPFIQRKHGGKVAPWMKRQRGGPVTGTPSGAPPISNRTDPNWNKGTTGPSLEERAKTFPGSPWGYPAYNQGQTLEQTWKTGEREAGQEWATGERKAGQTWQEIMNKLNQEFMTGEREAGQGFTASQNEAERIWRTADREAQNAWQEGESEKARAFERERDLAYQEWMDGREMRPWEVKGYATREEAIAGAKANREQRQIIINQIMAKLGYGDFNLGSTSETTPTEVKPIPTRQLPGTRQVGDKIYGLDEPVPRQHGGPVYSVGEGGTPSKPKPELVVYNGGRMELVGKRGPELRTFPEEGEVIPAPKTKQILKKWRR